MLGVGYQAPSQSGQPLGMIPHDLPNGRVEEKLMLNLTFAPTDRTPYKLSEYVALLQSAFPGKERLYTTDYLRWLYCQNPEGPVIGFDAWYGNRAVGHYVCIPLRARIQSVNPRRVLLSLNTATHPNYQGKGLFLKLAALTYALAAEQNYEAVIGVANANSTHGFVNRLGFQLVQPLKARVGVGPLRIETMATQEAAQDFMRVWSRDALHWRLATPHNQPRVVFHNNDIASFVAPTTNPAVMAWTERPADPCWSLIPGRKRIHLRPRVFIGLVPPIAARANAYVDIPDRLRPVPLNFIYKPLSNNVPARLDAAKMFFDFLDFDAF
jgi:hypothetical protein